MRPLHEAPNPDTQAVVQELLSAHGAYSPLELLLETSRLDYDDYRAWRRGERTTLDGALVHGANHTRTLVERAHAWARSLHLEAETVALYGTDDNAGAELTASMDIQLDELLHTQFRPAADRVQLDIFLDTSESRAAGEVVDALSTRNATAAESRLRRLTDLNPHHWAVNEADILIQALNASPPMTYAEALDRLDILERKWRPAACAVLHAGSRDFLTPLWRAIAEALDGAPFEAADPNHHASWAYLNGLDWGNVRRTVRSVPGHLGQPILLHRLAEAELRLRNRRTAIELWFALCRDAPEYFEEAIASAAFPDRALKNAWLAAQEEDLKPPITPTWFPAWVALKEPDMARAFAPRGGDSDSERAFDLMIALAVGGSDRQDIDNRRALQAIHPGLLQRYLDAVDA